LRDGNGVAAGEGSAIADNTVLNSDRGGGGVYISENGATVSHVLITGNRALRGGSGGGIYVRAEHTSIVSCEIRDNAAESVQKRRFGRGGLGGGVYIDEDLATLRDCRVSGNQSAIGGGGIYVVNSVNLILGGTTIVRGNQTAGAESNLCLGAGAVQEAYLVSDGLNADSAIGITLAERHGDKIVCGNTVSVGYTNRGTTIDQRIFRSDDDSLYFYWNSETNPYFDSSVGISDGRSSYNYRWIVALPKSRMPEEYTYVDASAPTDPAGKTEAVRQVGTVEMDGQPYPLIRGSVNIPSSSDWSEDLTVPFFYSDAWFLQDPKEYNPHLATLSVMMASAAGASNRKSAKNTESSLLRIPNLIMHEYLFKSRNIYRLLRDIGVADKDIHFNANNINKPGVNTIGVTIASKKINDKTLVIIGTRGSGYEAEWTANLMLGESGEAAGFRDAAEQVTEEIAAYLEEKGIDGSDPDTVFWIAGYSRGGATANLAAKRLVDRYDRAEERVFAYTFETPRGGLVEEAEGEYRCIHNIINPGDPVPYVAPAEMGFVRYGTDHMIAGTQAGTLRSESAKIVVRDTDGSALREITVTETRDNEAYTGAAYREARTAMIRQLTQVNPELIYDDYFTKATISITGPVLYGSNVNSAVRESTDGDTLTAPQFLRALLRDIQESGFNYAVQGTSKTGDFRRFYTTEKVFGEVSFQQAVEQIMAIGWSLDMQQLSEILQIVGSLPERMGIDSIIFAYLLLPDSRWYNYDSYGEIGRGIPEILLDRLWELLNERDDRKGWKALSDVLEEEYLETIHEVWKSLAFPFLYWMKTDYDRSGDRLSMVGTLSYNAYRLVQNHMPEVTLAYLRSADSLYLEEGEMPAEEAFEELFEQETGNGNAKE